MSSSSYAGRTHNGPQMARNCALCFDASASRSAVGVNIRFLLLSLTRVIIYIHETHSTSGEYVMMPPIKKRIRQVQRKRDDAAD